MPRIPISIDHDAVRPGLKQIENMVDSSMGRIQARINSVSGPRMSGGMAVAGRQGNQLVGMMSGMGSMTTGLGLGAAVGGAALLEQGLVRAIKKAKEFQTATLAIAATMGSIGNWKDSKGNNLSPGDQAQRNMWQAQKYRATILERSAKNILTFDEQLQAFQSGLAPGSRKGLKPNDILKLTEQTAIVAKTLGLRGEQIANASRLLMGGGVNVGRSTIGRALGIQNTDISSRSGKEFKQFIGSKMRGFDQMSGEFANSIEGLTSTLEAKIDVLSAKAGERFMRNIAPTMKQIGMLGAPERDSYADGAKGKAQYEKDTKAYDKQAKTMNTLVDAASKGFTGLFEGVKSVVESESFKTLLDIIVKIAGASKQIMLAIVFSKIAGAVGAATGALSRFFGVLAAAGGAGGGKAVLGGRGAMPIDLARSVLAGTPAIGNAARGLRGTGAAVSNVRTMAARLPYVPGPNYPGATPNAFGRESSKLFPAAASPAFLGRQQSTFTAKNRMFGTTPIPMAGPAAPGWKQMGQQLRAYESEAAQLQARLPWLTGAQAQTAQARLTELETLHAATSAEMQATPFRSRPLGERMAMRGRDFSSVAQQRLPMAMMGLMGGQMVKEAGWGTPGNIAGSTLQGGSLGYMTNGLLNQGMLLGGSAGARGKFGNWANANAGRLGMAGGVMMGLGSGISSAGKAASMQDLNKQTTFGQNAAMSGGGALKWGGAALMMTGNPLVAGGAAAAGAILDPLIGAMEKAAEQAKASAAALDDMRSRFPQAAAVTDISKEIGAERTKQSQGTDRQLIGSGKAGAPKRGFGQWVMDQVLAPGTYLGMFPGTESYTKGTKMTGTPLKESNLRIAGLEKRKIEMRKIATFETGTTGLLDEITKTTSAIDLLKKYGGKSIANLTKVNTQERRLGRLTIERDKSNIPVNFDQEAYAKNIVGGLKKMPLAKFQALQKNYGVWKAGRTDAEKEDGGDSFASYAGYLAQERKRQLQEKAAPRIKAEYDNNKLSELKVATLSFDALRATGSDRKSLADKYTFQSGLVGASSNWEGGSGNKDYKKFYAGQMKQFNQEMKDSYKQQILGIKGNALEREKLTTEMSRAPFESRLKAASLKNQGESIGLSGERLKLNGVQLGLKREQLGLDWENLGIADTLNEQQGKRMTQDHPLNVAEGRLNLKQAQLGQSQAETSQALWLGNMGPQAEIAGNIRQKVESEYASRFDPGAYEDAYRQKLKDDEAQLETNKQLAAINTKRAALGLDRIEEDYANSLIQLTQQKKGNQQAKKENAAGTYDNKLSEDENKNAQKQNDLDKQANTQAQADLPVDDSIEKKAQNLKLAILDAKDVEDRKKAAEEYKTLSESGVKVPELPVGKENEKYRRVKQLMDNGMNRDQAEQAVAGSDARAASQANESAAKAGISKQDGTASVSVGVTLNETINPEKFKSDFERWLKEYCSTQSYKAGS